MKKQQQIKQLKKIANKYNVPEDLYDWEAKVDEKISYEENKGIIEADIETLASSNDYQEKIKNDFKARKKTIKDEKEQLERAKLEEINKEIEHIEEQFKESLEHIQKNNSVLEKLYYMPKEYVKVVANKNNEIHGLILSGMAGVSKSFSTIQAANELDCNYSYFSGFTTPLSLYKYLLEHKDDDLIIIDDTISIFKNFQATTLLLNALHSNTDKRKVTWSSTKLRDISSEFILEANLVLIINEIPKNIGKSLLNSRCLTYEFTFTNFELLTIMKAIADTPHKFLSKEERHMIVKYISENIDESSMDFDLRIQNKVENLYLYSKATWKILAGPLLNTKDEKLSLLREFIRDSTTLKEAQEKWVEHTNLTPRQCRRYTARLKGGTSNVH